MPKTDATYRTPNLTAKHLLLPNRYRIGDSVAVMLLRKWVEDRYGKKDWYLEYPNTVLSTLSRFVVEDWAWYDRRLAYEEDGVTLKEHVEMFDDVNLWIWNDVFYRTGHRLDLHVPEVQGVPKVLFAPLLEADYSAERTMHPLFVVDVINALKGSDFAVLMPETINNADARDIEATGAAMISVSTLEEVIVLLGNTELFIGGDTGLSHIAGLFPDVKQVALHDRRNTERHIETIYDHNGQSRRRIREIIGEGEVRKMYLQSDGYNLPHYRSTPNKRGAVEIFFDHNGADGVTLGKVVEAVEKLWRR